MVCEKGREREEGGGRREEEGGRREERKREEEGIMFQLSNIYTRMFISDIHKTMRTTKPTVDTRILFRVAMDRRITEHY